MPASVCERALYDASVVASRIRIQMIHRVVRLRDRLVADEARLGVINRVLAPGGNPCAIDRAQCEWERTDLRRRIEVLKAQIALHGAAL